MRSRRSLLPCLLGPVALTGLLAVSRASARSTIPGLVGIDGWLDDSDGYGEHPPVLGAEQT
jgi:hypothetical protein